VSFRESKSAPRRTGIRLRGLQSHIHAAADPRWRTAFTLLSAVDVEARLLRLATAWRQAPVHFRSRHLVPLAHHPETTCPPHLHSRLGLDQYCFTAEFCARRDSPFPILLPISSSLPSEGPLASRPPLPAAGHLRRRAAMIRNNKAVVPPFLALILIWPWNLFRNQHQSIVKLVFLGNRPLSAIVWRLGGSLAWGCAKLARHAIILVQFATPRAPSYRKLSLTVMVDFAVLSPLFGFEHQCTIEDDSSSSSILPLLSSILNQCPFLPRGGACPWRNGSYTRLVFFQSSGLRQVAWLLYYR